MFSKNLRNVAKTENKLNVVPVTRIHRYNRYEVAANALKDSSILEIGFSVVNNRRSCLSSNKIRLAIESGRMETLNEHEVVVLCDCLKESAVRAPIKLYQWLRSTDFVALFVREAVSGYSEEPIHDNGEPQTLRVATAAPVSAAKTRRCPSEDPAARATPKGWNAMQMHSKPT